MQRSPVSETENEIESFLREQEESFDYDISNDERGGIVGGSTPRKRFGSDDDEVALTEDIRKMARALAPQISELEDVLKDFTDAETADALDRMKQPQASDMSRFMEDEDDDLDDEMAQLAMSEQALRDEMDIISMIGSPIPGFDDEEKDKHISDADLPSPIDLNNRLKEEQASPAPSFEEIDQSGIVLPSTYTLQDHADFLKLKSERTGRWYYCDMTSKLLPTVLSQAPSASAEFTEDLVKDYCLPVPFRKLKRLYGGLVFHDVWESKRQRVANQSRPPTNTPLKTPNKTPEVNQLLQTPSAGASAVTPGRAVTPAGFTMKVPVTPGTTAPSSDQATRGVNDQKPPRTPLKKISNSSVNNNNNVEEPLPVRTIAIRVRPDVLCGAIMDAAHNAFEVLPDNCTTHIIKRQGAHLRGAVYLPDKQLAYVADIQLVTQKNDTLDRRLLLRFYHIQDDPEALQELGQILQREQQQAQASPPQQPDSVTRSVSATSSMGEEENNDAANRHVKQSCSLIQRLMAAEQQAGGIRKMDHKQQWSWLGLKDKSFDSKAIMQYAIGSHLESSFQSCPSVRDENKKAGATIRRLTLPSLSKRDWPMLEVSWSLTNRIIEELDTRDCSYNTLSTLPFGQFPCLPTLDVQYCSQLRRLSRENMITYLLKSAKELEEYASLAEYNCALCITLLVPMMENYGVPALSLPTPRSLDEYPLNYTTPQVACPPWGGLVSDALNRVAAKTSTGEINIIDAVRLVYGAFTKQDDEEQGARLGRKNSQIMDRLANMQSHQRMLVQTLKDSQESSEKAAQSAAQFLKYSEQALNKGKGGYPSTLSKDVPLLDIKISLGASRSGRCFVTSKQIVFVTSYLPLLGSSRSVALDLTKIDFRVVLNPTSTLMNPFPNTMDVVLKSSNDLVFSFRPAMGPHRLHTFLTIIQGFASENRPSEFSQVVDSPDEKQILRQIDSQSESDDQDVTV